MKDAPAIVSATETMRLFVAVFPPAELAQRLASAAPELPPQSVTWTRTEQIHLTLNFLGNVPRASIGSIEEALEQASRNAERHTLRAQGLGCFPTPIRPRIIWAGLAGDLAPLEKLKQALDISLASVGYPPETRPFHAHLTLGRVKILSGRDRRRLAEALLEWQQKPLGTWQVKNIDLMQSVTSPAGAKYERIQSFDLPRSQS